MWALYLGRTLLRCCVTEGGLPQSREEAEAQALVLNGARGIEASSLTAVYVAYVGSVDVARPVVAA